MNFPMISNFTFDYSTLVKCAEMARYSADAENPLGLRLPIRFTTGLLNLKDVGPHLSAVQAHFASLNLDWWTELDRRRGGVRAVALLDFELGTGGVWALAVLERTDTGRHRHTEGGPYGECVITLSGELEDTLDDGNPVTLDSGAVMFHEGGTIHTANAPRFWAGLYHQPRGCTLA